MNKILLSAALAASLVTAAEYNYEITPLIGGVHTEGNLDLEQDYANAGLAFGFNATNTFFDQIELGFLTTIGKTNYENSTEETNVTRYFANIVKNYRINEEVSLYALAGIGYENFSNEQFNNEDSAFGNYGFGIKYNITDYFALKADVRHLIETDHGDNNLLYTLGFGYSFGEKAKPAPVVIEKPKEEPKPTPVKKVEAPKDSDKDGVIDPKDECPNTPAGLLVDAVGCTVLVDLNINFATDSAEITNQYNEKIVEFANLLNKDTGLKATINAHTDATGSEKYNQMLSQKRAESAVEALKKLNVDESRLSAQGFGESQPIATNSTKEGRASNRRVEASLERIK